MLRTIGERVAQLRQENGWTQQSLADRLAISRVAVSHIEMDISIPSERTITLLAGLLKITPHALVEGTTYPDAKTDRLPVVVCCYSALEVDLALLENDLAWLQELLNIPDYWRLKERVYRKWIDRLSAWETKIIDPQEKALFTQGLRKLNHLIQG